MKKANRKGVFLLSGCAGAAILAGCSGGGSLQNGTQTFTGPSVAVGNGQARSFVKLNNAGKPLEVGLVVSDAALNNLPTVPDTPFTVALPAQNPTAFDHISLDWESQGHDPLPIYGKPHFDVHFYTISQSEQAAIGFAPDEPAPAAQFLPPDYVSTHTVVPNMGQHWFDPTDPNNSPGNFNHTLIYGFHSGKMVFLEPMVTREFLLSKVQFESDIKQPSAFVKAGLYPTHYSIVHSNEAGSYRITLSGFVQHG